MTIIHFVRHGLVYNPQHIYYGRLPHFTLSEEGLRQAQAAARALATRNVAAIFSSPMLRARKTAHTIAAYHQGLKVQISKLINEVHVPFDGQPIAKLEQTDWEFYSHHLPGYEMPDDIMQRVWNFIARSRRNYRNQEVIAVTHGDIVAFSLTWAKGLPITGESKRQMARMDGIGYPATASITSFTFHTDAPDEVPTYTYQKPY